VDRLTEKKGEERRGGKDARRKQKAQNREARLYKKQRRKHIKREKTTRKEVRTSEELGGLGRGEKEEQRKEGREKTS
jgi:hypothetical protein